MQNKSNYQKILKVQESKLVSTMDWEILFLDSISKKWGLHMSAYNLREDGKGRHSSRWSSQNNLKMSPLPWLHIMYVSYNVECSVLNGSYNSPGRHVPSSYQNRTESPDPETDFYVHEPCRVTRDLWTKSEIIVIHNADAQLPCVVSYCKPH
jgi:hypothetical protein